MFGAGSPAGRDSGQGAPHVHPIKVFLLLRRFLFAPADVCKGMKGVQENLGSSAFVQPDLMFADLSLQKGNTGPALMLQNDCKSLAQYV